MSSARPDDWSPADNPYAIAVSQSQLWLDIIRLTVRRMRDPDDSRAGRSSRQLDAHVLVMILRQLLTAQQLEQAALTELGIDTDVGTALASAREQFEDALPGIKDMRDALTHFDEWAQGTGRGPQARRRKDGTALREVAREYWPFGYDPANCAVSFGPYMIHIDVAERAATELCASIYAAARAVDAKNTAELRAKVVKALSHAGIQHDSPGASLTVSAGSDASIWLTLKTKATMESERRELSEQIISALSAAGLSVESPMQTDTLDSAERLAHGEALYAKATQPE